MALTVWLVDGQKGSVELDHLQRRTVSVCVAAAGLYPIHRVPVDATVKAVRGYRVGGTGAVINAQKGVTDLGTDLSLTGADAWMAGTLSATPATLQLAVGDTIVIEVVSVAGAPTSVTVEVEYEINNPPADA